LLGLPPLLVDALIIFEEPAMLEEVVCTVIDSRGDRGDEEIGREPPADKFA